MVCVEVCLSRRKTKSACRTLDASVYSFYDFIVASKNALKLQIKSFIILGALLQSVYRVGGAISASLRPGNTVPFKMSQRWQHCEQFDQLEIWPSDLPFQRRTCYRSTKRWVTSKFTNWCFNGGWRITDTCLFNMAQELHKNALSILVGMLMLWNLSLVTFVLATHRLCNAKQTL